ncbi:MAG: DUF5106 domain-containing protein [Bacteroidales bacterium]|nr:DUF5106 domain-containing protein [Bacteroidales bacterium]
MIKRLTIIALVAFTLSATAQNSYKISFASSSLSDGKYYMGQHFRDTYLVIDSANATAGSVTFAQRAKLTNGVYTLLNDKKSKLFDFMVDDSRNFTITFDEKRTNAGMKVKGSKANELMYSYLAKLDDARSRSRDINERRKNGDAAAKAKADKEIEALTEEMKQFEENYLTQNSKYQFTQLVGMFANIDVPNELPANSRDTSLREWQARYFRSHYWDKVDLTDHSLIYTPHLFDKMNYYFFGLLYYQDCDTITKYAHNVLDRVVGDSTMLRYFLDFITPKYERSTKNIGWDQVYVNLLNDYYLAGKCPWATEGDIYSKRQSVAFLSQSLIGAMGQELVMADTNQSDDPKDWISSHALPEKYVMLWFWDPDCNHCKKQTAELIVLYDSLLATGSKPFEVYAVGYESDTQKWIKYVREHKLPFINVGGPNVNIDYQEAYNVHGAPTMILLNADRQIIMNKTLPTNQVLPFLKRYEEEHPEQKDRNLSQWQKEGYRRGPRR